MKKLKLASYRIRYDLEGYPREAVILSPGVEHVLLIDDLRKGMKKIREHLRAIIRANSR